MFSKPFQFNETEAKIVAKWEIGVRNYIFPLTAALVVVFGLVEVVRYVTKTPLPPVSFYIADAVAVCGFVLVLYYIGRRVEQTAREIMKRELAVDFNLDESYFAVVEYGGKLVFRAQNADVERIDIGPNVVRMDGRAGAICLPSAQVPEAFLTLMQKQLGREKYTLQKWM